ncbi:hypothetical protein CLPU_9c00740 [Gottschalkia purinilytica]|uniref:Uncharacterized protein n=1 Tax=Gottschalkia purinilytica TaxID=1503 RepID=A0A0L0W9E6_GOTPU|nr:Imm32 family immunity protein [Gottschalkia purinilytica]KNF08178.1 hypothetical protein CLPU_9c00740 [Gottschalkia purinilytica]
MCDDYLLTFEISDDRNELEIHATKEGLQLLKEEIDILINAADNDHVHLFTPSWGGEDLTEELQNKDDLLINKVTLFKWK